MKYMGSKNRIAKHIVPILNKFNNRPYYIEPFVGGANIIDKVDFQVRKGYDKNVYLTDLLKEASTIDRWFPARISEDEYYKVRDNKNDFENWHVGLVGFCASYGGRFFEGYPRGKNKDGISRDYTNEAIRNIETQRQNLRGVIFSDCDYSELDLSEIQSLIYCDPPYKGSKPYKIGLLGKFDHNKFWDWVREQSEYNPVIVSEYEAPNDFVCIWESESLKSNLKGKGTKTSIEKLFIDPIWLSEYDLKRWKEKKEEKDNEPQTLFNAQT